MFRFFTIFLLISLFFQTAYSASDCELLLVTCRQQSAAIHRELNKLIQSSPPAKRIYLKIRTAFAKNRILKDCAQGTLTSGTSGTTRGCTHAQVAQAVAQVVEDAIAKNPLISSDALGYGFLVRGIIANAAASTGITVWVNPQAEFLPTFVGFSLGQVTFIAASLISPFSEPISAKIRRFAFGLKERNNLEHGQAVGSKLEAQADAIHATYTLREQYATDRIFVFRNALRLNFQTAAVAFQSGDHEAVAAEIADAAMAGYQYFKDIDPSERAIVNTIHASFLIKIKNPSSLKGPVLTLIKERSTEFDAKAEAYYLRALDAWLMET